MSDEGRVVQLHQFLLGINTYAVLEFDNCETHDVTHCLIRSNIMARDDLITVLEYALEVARADKARFDAELDTGISEILDGGHG